MHSETRSPTSLQSRISRANSRRKSVVSHRPSPDAGTYISHRAIARCVSLDEIQSRRESLTLVAAAGVTPSYSARKGRASKRTLMDWEGQPKSDDRGLARCAAGSLVWQPAGRGIGRGANRASQRQQQQQQLREPMRDGHWAMDQQCALTLVRRLRAIQCATVDGEMGETVTRPREQRAIESAR